MLIKIEFFNEILQVNVVGQDCQNMHRLWSTGDYVKTGNSHKFKPRSKFMDQVLLPKKMHINHDSDPIWEMERSLLENHLDALVDLFRWGLVSLIYIWKTVQYYQLLIKSLQSHGLQITMSTKKRKISCYDAVLKKFTHCYYKL